MLHSDLIQVKCVLEFPINQKLSFVKVMARRQTVNVLSSDPMMA